MEFQDEGVVGNIGKKKKDCGVLNEIQTVAVSTLRRPVPRY